MLKLMEKAGEISDIKFQQTFFLTKARISWKADFSVLDTKLNAQVIYEAKGMETERFRVIKKLWKEYGLCPLRIYYGDRKPIVEIIPTGASSFSS